VQGATFAEALEEWGAKAEGKQVWTWGYHMAITDLVNGETLESCDAGGADHVVQALHGEQGRG